MPASSASACCCRWPIGDPQLAEFHFCGKAKVTGLPYCEFHARRAFQPPQVKRRAPDTIEPRVPSIEAGPQPAAGKKENAEA